MQLSFSESWLPCASPSFALCQAPAPAPPPPPSPRSILCLTQVAPVVDASSSQSRSDVVVIVLSAVLLLTGLQWLALKPRVVPPVSPWPTVWHKEALQAPKGKDQVLGAPGEAPAPLALCALAGWAAD